MDKIVSVMGQDILYRQLTIVCGLDKDAPLLKEIEFNCPNDSERTWWTSDTLGSHTTPAKQRLWVKLILDRLRKGYNILLYTNSDYCIKELNSYIMIHSLNHDISKTYPEYPTGCGLDYKLVSAYEMFNGELVACDINENIGIEVKSFDKEIDYQNEVSSHIYYGKDGWD